MRNVRIKNLEAAMTHFTLSLENGFPSVVSSSSFTLYITQDYGWEYSISQIQVKCTDYSFQEKKALQTEKYKIRVLESPAEKAILFFLLQKHLQMFVRSLSCCMASHLTLADEILVLY